MYYVKNDFVYDFDGMLISRYKVLRNYTVLKDIGPNAFQSCSALKTIRLPQKLERIGTNY